MPRFSIITVGTAGVDMRRNPLFLTNERAAFALNLAFDESTIRTRPGFRYTDLGRKGKFQGAAYVAPSLGISAASYTHRSSALVLVVDGIASVHPTGEKGIEKPVMLEGGSFEGDTFIFAAEQHVIFLNRNGATFWWSGGISLTRSPGIQPESGENTHDAPEAKNWLPHRATIGVYIHGRTHVSVPFSGEGCAVVLNSELWVSDPLTKRGPDVSDDILAMEEALLDSCGGPLVAPSRLGMTLAMEVLPTGAANGEGALFDFRENGVVAHDTLTHPRETLAGENGEIIQQGWDEKRISNVRLQTVSATGRYAVAPLPDDLWFRSDYGFHFLKKTLGQGTLRDEHLNQESHDIQPLIDADEDGPVHGAAAGHWLKGNRFLGTAGFRESAKLSSSAFGTGIVSYNQATTLTEDGTPRPLWEGLWKPDQGVVAIHRFLKAGARPRDRRYGFISSLGSGAIHFAEFDTKSRGVEVRGAKEIPIRWKLVTAAFLMTGSKNVDAIRSGFIEFVGDASTRFVKISIRTDENECWSEWSTITPNLKETFLVSRSFGEPTKPYREATWFQFMVEGEGFVELRFLDVEAVKIVEKNDGRNHAVPVCTQPETWFEP